MLEIRDIRKKYVTGNLVQTALDGVSLSLRDSEFVAILGPSGSGKTTLLNIIGGLDRYDSGDLIINGVSTQKYTDRDWDSYRNHTIGFVFQSYNLIPHQSVLANVELALTISGISGSERRRRAVKALEEVGLGDQIHKRPNQLSGGQMQRVAIARALVNDPDILLADEPTGALDTVTSVQVMELLKEVAKNRLVVMVTHNPELAEEYATRIVRVRDGKIISDSDPFTAVSADVTEYRNMGKASMSFLTSLALSFNNLRTKLGRTILTAFAGSIGIIGIALIMSLSNGVNLYIKSVEEDTLSEYPLTIQSTGMDLNRLLERPDSSDDEERKEEIRKADVRERQIVNTMFSGVSRNDLKSLREFIEGPRSHIYDYANAVEYTYNVIPQIYRLTGEDSYRQVNPDRLSSMNSFASSSAIGSSLMAQGRGGMFISLPENEGLYRTQYDVLAGRWPENYTECLLVLSHPHYISDMMLYTLGLKDASELDMLIEALRKNESMEIVSERGLYSYEDFIGIEFRLVDAAECYEYDSEYNVFVNKTDNTGYMLELIRRSMPLTIVGVVAPNDSDSASMLSGGIYYSHELTEYIVKRAVDSEIVKKQIAEPSIDVFTGKEFNDDSGTGLELNDLITVNRDSLAKAFTFDPNKLDVGGDLFSELDMSNVKIDFSQITFSMPGLDESVIEKVFSDMASDISEDEMRELFNRLIDGYLSSATGSSDYRDLNDAFRQYLESDEAARIIDSAMTDIVNSQIPGGLSPEGVSRMIADIMSGFPEYVRNNATEETDTAALLPAYLASDEVVRKMNSYARQTTGQITVPRQRLTDMAGKLVEGFVTYVGENAFPDPDSMSMSFADYLASEEGSAILREGLEKAIDTERIRKSLKDAVSDASRDYQSRMEKEMQSVLTQIMNQVASQMTSSIEKVMGRLGNSMMKAFNINTSALSNAFQINMSADDLQELMMSMMSGENATYESNLRKLNWADMSEPVAISIYPKDFESKESIKDILKKYNEDMDASGNEDKVITYTDYVGALMSSVTGIIDTISYVLIAFVAISLVVSSIMIGIITYISVLERTKEIGILRAIGASKRNIAQVFNAETFIIGLLAGVIGIRVALLLLIPGNALIHTISGNYLVNAVLPPVGAVALVIISVVLTLIGGIIPSRSAARKDPVTALRTE